MLLVCTIAANGQNYVKKGGFRFDVEKSTKTSETLTVENKTFDIYVTDKGAKFVKAISKAGKPYPVWIGADTGDKFEGRKVYVYKSNQHCYYKLTKSGFPYPVYLEKNH